MAFPFNGTILQSLYADLELRIEQIVAYVIRMILTSVSTVSSPIIILAAITAMVCIGRSDPLDLRGVPDGEEEGNSEGDGKDC